MCRVLSPPSLAASHSWPQPASLSLLLLVLCKGLETERNANLIGLFEADTFFHGDVETNEGTLQSHCDRNLFGYTYVVVSFSLPVATS